MFEFTFLCFPSGPLSLPRLVRSATHMITKPYATFPPSLGWLPVLHRTRNYRKKSRS